MADMTIAPLSWNKIGVHEWVAETPAATWAPSKSIWCHYEQGKYWPSWGSCIEGCDTKEEVMAEGQKFHDQYIKDFITKYTISTSE